jgi:hypothetical protein
MLIRTGAIGHSAAKAVARLGPASLRKALELVVLALALSSCSRGNSSALDACRHLVTALREGDRQAVERVNHSESHTTNYMMRLSPFFQRTEIEDVAYQIDASSTVLVLVSGPSGSSRIELAFDFIKEKNGYFFSGLSGVSDWELVRMGAGDDSAIAATAMSDIRTIATAVEAHHVDRGGYPAVGSLAELRPQVSPVYIRALPEKDGWGSAYQYSSDGSSYEVRSLGSDSMREPRYVGGPVGDSEADIVFVDGKFVQWPAGISPAF